VVIDCRHSAALARFWAAALDGYAIAPYDDAELARLRDLGVDDPADDPNVLVKPAAAGPRLFLQRVSECNAPESRVVACRRHQAEARWSRSPLPSPRRVSTGVH
jgi:hypothetical protein